VTKPKNGGHIVSLPEIPKKCCEENMNNVVKTIINYSFGKVYTTHLW
jgi:hypothetical protein